MEPWASPFSAGIGVRQPLGGSLQLKWFHESRRGEHSSSCTPMGRAKGPPQRIPAIHPTWSWRTAASSSHLHVQTHQTEEKTITKVPLLPWDPPPVWQLHAAVPTHTSNLPTWFPLGVSGPDAVDTSHKPPPISSRYDTHRRSAPWTWGHVERTPLFGAPEFCRDKMRTRLSYLFFFVERHGYWKTKRITRARIVGGKAAEGGAGIPPPSRALCRVGIPSHWGPVWSSPVVVRGGQEGPLNPSHPLEPPSPHWNLPSVGLMQQWLLSGVSMAGGGGRPCSPQRALLGMVAIMAVVVEARWGAPGRGSGGV